MNVHFIRATARMALLGTALSGLAACASAQPEAARPAVQQVEDTQAASTPVTPPPPAPAARPASTVAELQSLIQNRQVSELRTTYNGTYGASLLFKPDDLTYYVALFQQGFLARGQDPVGQAGRGHLPRLRRPVDGTGRGRYPAHPPAGGVRPQRKLLASRNAQLSTLQADNTLRMQQEKQVAARQQQSRQEATALADQQKDVRQQLRDLQRQIDALQAQQAQLGGAGASSKQGR